MLTARAGAVFQDDFEGASRPEWSSATRDNSYPGTFSQFLGRIGNSRSELTLTGLEPGAAYKITFDLYVLDSWDGSNAGIGPDTFRVLVDGAAVLDRTISQFDGPQTWDRPADVKGQLGFSGWADSIFRQVPVRFTASASTVVLGFEGANLQEINDESWGIDNVSVWSMSELAASGFVASTLPSEGASRAMAVDMFELDALVELDEATSVSSANHSMRGAGPNRAFGDEDDVVAALEVSRIDGGRRLRVRVASGALPPGLWRYQSGAGIRDVDGNAVGVLTRGFEVLAPSPVFEDDFEGRLRPEWSSTTRDLSYPGTFSRFLGRVGNERVELTLSRLVPGTSYTVLMDLYVFDSWDGNGYGPDTFRVRVDGVAALDRTISQFDGAQTWGMPADVKGQLGFSGWEDSIFRRVPVTFTASASAVVLGFEGANLESLDNESWGIDNVSVWRTEDLATKGFVTSTLPPEGTVRVMALDRFEVGAWIELDPVTSTSATVHEMRGAGPNRVFGDGDDGVMAVQVSGTGAPGRLRVLLPGGPLQPGLWRYRTLPGLMTAGGGEIASFTRTFEVVNPVLGGIEGLENDVLVGAGSLPVNESPAGLGTFVGYGLGTFFAAGDVDYWRFEAEAGDRVTVTLEATDQPGIYPWLQVRTAADGVISQAQGGYWEGRSRLEGVVLSSPGTYYLRVWSDHGASGYRLRVERGRAWQGEASPSTPVVFRNEGGNLRGRVAGHLDAWGGADRLDLGMLGAGTTVRAEATFPDGSDLSGAALTLTLEDGAGAAVESATGGLLNRLVASSGAYRLRVSSGTMGFRAAYVVTVDMVDATAPTVVSAALPSEGSTSTGFLSSWNVEWSEELDPASAGNGGNYALRRSNNGVFGDGDDVVIPVTPSYAGGVNVGIVVPGPLQPGRYRFTVGTGVGDRSGNALAVPYVREFAVANVEGFVMEGLANDGFAGATALGPLGAEDGSFLLRSSLPVGNNPHGIAQGDLDGDGHADLVVANTSGGAELTVYPGNGDGSFGLPRPLSAGGFGVAVAIGDLDGDDDLDVVASNHWAHRVSILENLGDLNFAEPVSYAVGNHPRDLRLGDLDGDGIPEIVVPVQREDFLVVLKRDRETGGYVRTNYPNGGNAWAVALGDLNGDGREDVVTASHERSGLQVLLNNGDGALEAARSLSLPSSHIDVAVEDMDGDGRMDVVALDYNGSGVRVLRGDGAGGFAGPTLFTGLGGGAYHLAVADYDGDGDRDVAVAGYASSQLGVFSNRGGGDLGTPTIYSTAGNPIALVTGDWNEDGVKDIATAHYNGGSAGVWLGQRAVGMVQGPTGLSTVVGRGSLSPHYTDMDYYRFTARAGDLLVVGVETVGSPAASQLYYRVDDASGNYVTDFYASSYNGWGQKGPVTLGRDGSYFLRVSYNYDYRGEYRVRVNLLRGGLQSEGDTQANDRPGSPSGLTFALEGGKLVARVAGAISTGDGPDHFRLGDLSEGTTVRLALESVPGTTLAARLALVRPDGTEVAVGAEGATTLVHEVGAGGGLLLARVTADGGAGIQGQYVLGLTMADERPPTIASVDLPSEGASTTALVGAFQATFSEDMASATVNGAANVEVRSSVNEVFGDSDDSVYSVAGVGYAGGRKATFQIADGPLQPGRYQVTLRAGLTDRSGNPMAASYVRRFEVLPLAGFISENRSNNRAYGSTPMGPTGGADGSWALAATLGAGANPYDIGTGDLDGDGRADLVVANINAGNLSVWYGNGDGTFTAADPLPCQSGPISVVVGDVDGDGRADVVAVNHYSNTATIHRGNGSRTFVPAQSVSVGVNPRNVRLGDLDGDGRPEILVANQSSGFVTILKPDGTGGFARQDLGVGFGTWSVAAGDLDGDGRVDMVAVGSSGLAVLKGGAGGLALESLRPVTGEPADVALVDLDGDGDLDAAVLNRTGRSLAIFRNNGGAFPAAPEYVGGLGSEPYHLTATDLDGDGDPDFAVAVYGSGQWARWMNDGAGGLGSLVAMGTGGNPIGIVAGDWNGDGIRDVATANHAGSSVSIWLGNRTSLLAEGPAGLLTGLARGRLADTSDYDFYRFSARAGDVLTVAVETEGNPPASQLYYRVDGPTGEYITDFYANSYNGWGQSAPVTLMQGGSYTVFARYNYDYRGEYRLRVSLARGGMQSEREDNNSAGAANEIVLSPAGGRATGRIVGYFRQDEGTVGDFYRVAAVGEGQALEVSWAPVTVGKVGASMVVRGPSGEVVGSGDATTALRIVPTAGQGGTHTIQVLPTVPRRTAAARSNLRFLGNTQVRVPLNVPEDAMTVSFWFLSFSSDSGLFEVGASGNDRHIYLSGGNILARIYNNEIIGSSGLNLGDGRWHHVAYQYGAAIGGQRIYVDGSLVASGSKASSDFTWQTDVGFGYSSDRGHLVGALEDVSIWNSALPEDRVLALRTTALSGSEPGLIGIWPLNEGTGTTVTALGGVLPGTISGPAAWGTGVAGASWVGIETAYVLTASVEDAVAPTVTDLDVAAEGGTTTALVNGLTLAFSEDMDAATVRVTGNYELRGSGNGVFGDGDDEVYGLAATGYVSGLAARLGILGGPLQPGTYQFTAGAGLRDRAGNPLAGPFVRTFTVGKLGLFVAENRSNDSAIRGTAVGTPGDVTRDLFRAGDLSSPGSQHELASGDLDGDGIDDLVVASNGQTFARVFLGRGDGTFREPLDVATGRSATGVQVGDVDGDGRNDLVLANHDHHGVTVVRNVGAMTFGLPVFMATGQNPLVTRLVDLDADGIPEIVVANRSSYFLTVLRRAADGTYGRVDIASDGRPGTLAVGDVDGDGRVDVLASNWWDASVSVYRNNGAGGLSSPVSLPVASYPRGIGLGDLTGDGRLDIVVVQHGNQSVGVLAGRGDGTFDVPVQYAGAGTEPWLLAVDDLDADGRVDVVVGAYGSNRLVRYFNEVGGVLGVPVALPGNNNPIGVVTGDWNRDGVRDVASANHGGGVTLWLGTRGLDVAEDPAGLTSILVRGAMEKDQDEDWFRFSARAGDVLQVNTETAGSPGGSQLYVEVFGPSGATVMGTYSGSTGSLTTDPVVLTEDGVHAMRVRIPWWWGYNYRGEYRAWVGLGRGGLSFERDPNQADGVGTASPVSFVLSGGVQRARVAGHVASVDSGDVFQMGNLGGGTTVRASLESPADGTLVAGLDLLDATGAVLASAAPGTALQRLLATSGPCFVRVRPDGGRGLSGRYVLNLSWSDSTPPVIASTGLPAEGTSTEALLDAFEVRFSEDMDAATVNDVGNVEVRVSANGVFGDGDDVVYAVASPGYAAGTVVTYGVPGGPLVAGNVRVTLGTGLKDGSGNRLASAFIQQFQVRARTGFVREGGNNGGPAGATRLGSTPSTTPDGSFARAAVLGTGANPYDLAGTDLDGDGLKDLVVANWSGHSVQVFHGNGDGTFQSPTAYPTGANPYSMLLEDLTGDGKADVATANYYGGSITLWTGAGDGTFSGPLTWPVSGNPLGIAAGDVDGDGDVDVVVTRNTANAVSVILRTGPTGVAPGASVPTGAGPAIVRLARVNSDAHLDMVVAHYNGASVGVYLGNGTGGFAAPSLLATPYRPHTLEVVDLDGDGVMDIAVANEGAASLSVFKGSGDGTFGPRTDLPSGNNPYVHAVDLDRDGRPELVAGNYGSGTVGLWRNRGDGTFSPMTTLAGSLGGPTRVASADWNGDGIPDLASANYGGNNVSVLLGNGVQTLSLDLAGNGIRSAAAYGRLTGSGDADWWSFGARAGEKLVLATENPGRPGASQLYFRIVAANGDTVLGFYPDYYGTGQSPVFTVPADGTYFVLVSPNYGYYSEYQFRLVLTPSGASPETESNNAIASATPLRLSPSGEGHAGVGVGHVHSAGDLDYFDLGTVEAGRTVFLNVRLQSGATFQPVVGVYDALNGYRLEASGGRGFDGVAEVDVVSTGRYYAVVRGSGSQGGLLQAYVLEALLVPTSTVGLPNLQVTSVATPSGPLRSGDHVTVEFQVANVGRQPTGASAWTDRVVLSSNATLGDIDDIPLGVVSRAGALGAGESYSVSRSLRIPDGVSGEFFVLVQADSGNAVTEFVLENDNVTSSAAAFRLNLADYPDLVVESLSVSKGASILPTWTLANRGPGSAPAGWRESVALRNVDSGTVVWREERVIESSMAPGSTSNRSTAPPWPAPGRYRLEVVVDVGDDVFEFNDASHASAEGNNVASAAIDVERDLAVANLRIEPADTLRAGAPIVVRWDIAATGDIPAGGPWVDRVRVVNRTTGAVLLDTTTTGREASLTLPVLGAGVGQIEAAVTVDAANAIPEFALALDAESNNTAFVLRESEPAPYPDLVAAVGDVPAAADAGQPVTLSWTVSNAGNAAGGTSWRDDVYLSPGTGLEGARLLGSFLNDASSPSGGALAAGASILNTSAFIVPTDLSGALRVIVVSDAGAALTEPNELNNRAASAGTVLVRKPNLVPSAVLTPTVADAGETIDVRWTVTNAGNGATFSGWRASIALSASPDGSGPVVMGSLDRTESLAASGVVEQVARVTLPGGFAGDRFVVVNLDTAGQVAESNESDNTAVSAVALGLRAPNLSAVEVAGPASAAPGVPFEVRWTARNAGTAAASAPWTDGVYFSTDAVLGGDVFLASVASSDPLAAGASRDRTASVVVPVDGPAGDLHLLVATDTGNAVSESNESDNVGVSAAVVTVPLTLTVTGGAESVPENGAPLTFTVTRNGDRSADLFVTLSSSYSRTLTVPAGVTIPAGQASTTFSVTPVADGVVRAGRAETVSVGAAGFFNVVRQVTVTDVDVPRLTLALDAAEMGEGASVPARVTRDPVTSSSLTVNVVSTAPGQFLLPASVTIPAGEPSVAFAVVTVDDLLVEADVATTLTVTAAGHSGASRPLTVVDDDTFTLGLSLAATTFSEGAGPVGTVGTVTRNPVTSQAITVVLASSDPTAATVPPSVTISAGQASATFNVAAVNDAWVDGSQATEIDARSSVAGRPAVVAAPVTATVTDDDGPMLTLTLGASAAREGASPALLGTVRRNTSTSTALVVALASDNVGEATVPATVEIPAGAAAATFPVATVADGATDGAKTVHIMASAAGHESSTASLTVTDSDVADLVVAWVESPGVVETESITSARYRVENRGNVAATGPFIVRLYTSVDAVAGGDTYAAQYTFPGNLPAGGHFEINQSFTVPRRVGPLYLVAEVDPVRAVTELAEDNNSAVSAAVMDVRAAYTAVAYTDVSVAMAGTPVPIRGTVTRGSGAPAAGASVTVHVVVRGTRRTLGAIADGLGSFAVTFHPLPGEAGNYEIAAAHPGISEPTVQDAFTLVGIRIETPGAMRVVEGQSAASGTRIQNLSGVPVTGLTVETTEVPPGLTVTPSLGSTTLAGNGSVDVAYGVAVADGTTTGGMVRFRVTGSGGITGTFEVPVIVEPLRPNLVAVPGSLERGMRRGVQTTVQFDLVNRGGRPTGPLRLLLPPLSWMRVAAGGEVNDLWPGETNPVTVVLTPPADLPLGPYTGSFYAQAEQVGVNVPFTFRAMSEALGTLRVEAVDEFTYYAEGEPRVAGATVVVLDAVTGSEVARQATGANGMAEFAGLREDYYRVEVTADGHGSYRGTHLVDAARTTAVTAFLPRQTVRYRWTVEPIQVEDRTKITIETVFETAVPVPVVTMEPSVVDLSEVAGDETQVDMTITNHGLIAAKASRFVMPTHPGWEFIPLISEVGDIPAKTSLTIPMTVRRLGGAGGGALVGMRRGARTAGTGGPCVVGGGLIWELVCGPRTNAYTVPVTFNNAGTDCGGGGGGGGGGGWGGGFGGGGGGGGGGPIFVFNPPDISMPEICDCKYIPRVCLEGGFEFDLGGKLESLVSAVLSKLPSARLTAADMKLSFSGEICTCCVDNSISWEGKATGSGSIKAQVEIGPGVAAELPFEAPPPWKSVSVDGRALAGVRLTLTGNIEGTYEKKCNKEPTLCIQGNAHLQAFAGAEFEGNASATLPLTLEGVELGDVGFSGHVGGQIGMEGNIGATFNWCRGSGGSITVCGNLVARANIGGSLEATLPDGTKIDRSITLSADRVLAGGECDAGGDRLGAAPAAGGRRARVAGGFDGPFTEPLAGDLFPLPTAEIAKALNLDRPPDAVCARVKLKLEQEAVLTRDAFRAMLELENADVSALSDIDVSLRFRDGDGADAAVLFGVRPPEVTAMGAVDGSGTLAANTTGKSTWVLIPTRDAAGSAPKVYRVGGTLRYRQNGVLVTVPLADVPITVHPQPLLSLQYFHQRDVYSDDPFTPEVEPSIPYALGVMVRNDGFGQARNFRISSAQPQIVENERGLLIDFQLIGTQVAGEEVSPSLTANFGAINAGDIKVGRWLFTSSLQGLFIDYSAKFEHIDSLGNPRLSLIDAVSIHEMIHQVEAQGDLADGKPDFLVNDQPDVRDLPDTLYLSQGGTNHVEVVEIASVDSAPSGSDTVVELTATMPAGWAYLRVPEPSDGSMRLTRIVRSDGRELPVDRTWWVTDRTFGGMGRRPTRENILHLLDDQSTGRYTLHYNTPTGEDHVAPSSAVGVLPVQSPRDIGLAWSGTDDASGVAGFDVYVSEDGGPYALWLEGTTLRGALYRGDLGRTYRFYTVAFDRSGNREAAPGAADATTTVAFETRGPVLGVINDVGMEPSTTYTGLPYSVEDPDTPLDLLGVSFVSSNTSLLPVEGVVSVGTGPTRTLSLTPVPGQYGTADVTMRVTDGTETAVRLFKVTVYRPNRAPLAGNDVVSVTRATSVRIPVATLLGNDSDPDGDTVFVDSVSPLSAAGGRVQLRGLFVVYTPPADGPTTDTFVYTAGDGFRGLTTATVQVTLTDPETSGSALSLANMRATPQSVVLEFVGVRGRQYRIERSPDMQPPWTALGTATADAFGRFRFEDTSPLGSMGFYRIVRVTEP
jgi:hypothetical protein